MDSQQKDVGSSEETGPESTAVVLSRTTSPTQSTSGSVGAAACPSSTPTEKPSSEIDWHRAFQVLSATLGRQFISGDLVALVAYNIRDDYSEEVAKEFLRCVHMNRSSFLDDFMG